MSVSRPFLCYVDQAVDRAMLRTSCTPVNRAVDWALSIGRWAVDQALPRPALMPFSLPLTFDLCTISSIYFISSLPILELKKLYE